MQDVKEVKIRKKKKLGSYPYVSVVFSISLALFVIGLFGLLILHASKLTQIIRENIEIQVYLNQTISDNDQIKVQKTLAGRDYIAITEDGTPKVRFISKEEAAESFIDQTGEDFIQFLGENPLRDAYVINIRPEFYDTKELQKIKLDIERINGVFEVTYVESLINSINKNIAKISLVLMGFAVLLVIIVAVLINNTIRLALFSQRFLIRSMQLVGATRGFIKKPFLFRSLIHGIVAGICAALLLLLLLNYANQQIEDLDKLQEPAKITIMLIGLLLIGGFMGLLSTYRAVNKYLKMSLDELY